MILEYFWNYKISQVWVKKNVGKTRTKGKKLKSQGDVHFNKEINVTFELLVVKFKPDSFLFTSFFLHDSK